MLMSLWNSYAQPSSVDEALELLVGCTGRSAIIAGGTDLLLDLQQGRHPPVDLLLDVTEIEEMTRIDQIDDHIFLGAAVTHAAIVTSALLQRHAACLVQGCGLIGGPQVRNVATIGGNVAHALPAGDGTIALLALGARAQLATQGGRIWLPLEDLFAGPGEAAFDSSRTVLVGFNLPLSAGREASAFRRVMRPQGVAIAILNMAAWLRQEDDGRLHDIRLAIGPGGPVPLRALKTEAALRGQRITKSALQAAVQTLLAEAQLRTSMHRATHAYRVHLAGYLLERTIMAALADLPTTDARDQNRTHQRPEAAETGSVR
jgi:CO/xanthine dehydrogenase FAD-binding subunit